MTVEKAVSELRNGAGSQFDPDVVAALLRVLEPASEADPTGGLSETSSAARRTTGVSAFSGA